MKINILNMSKVRWQGAGNIMSGTFELYYSGGTEHERGVPVILNQEMRKTVRGY